MHDLYACFVQACCLKILQIRCSQKAHPHLSGISSLSSHVTVTYLMENFQGILLWLFSYHTQVMEKFI